MLLVETAVTNTAALTASSVKHLPDIETQEPSNKSSTSTHSKHPPKRLHVFRPIRGVEEREDQATYERGEELGTHNVSVVDS